MRRITIAVLTGVLAACAGGEEAPQPDPDTTAMPDAPADTSNPADDIASSLMARVEGEGVRFALNVTNAGGAPIRLDFNSGQRFDVLVTDTAGNSVWTWSASRSFIQALGSETIEPGQTLTYDAEWPDAPPGSYRATGIVTAGNRDIRQEVDVHIPAESGG